MDLKSWDGEERVVATLETKPGHHQCKIYPQLCKLITAQKLFAMQSTGVVAVDYLFE